MKKVKRILTGLLAGIIAFASFNSIVVKAEETQVSSVSNADEEMLEGSQQADGTSFQDDIISPAYIKDDQSVDYATTQINIPEGSEDAVLIYPVAIPKKGAVTFAVAQADTVPFASLAIGLYQDASCTKQCGNTIEYQYGDMATAASTMFCPSSGTYYLKAVLNRKDEVTDAKSFTLVSVFTSNASRTLEQGKLVYAYADDKNKDIMYRIKVKKAGVIGFYAFANDTSALFEGTVTLYNAKKKAVSAKEHASNSEDTSSDIKYLRAYYTVKKGTYYIKFSKTTSSINYYFAGYNFKAVKDSAGASKAKAATVKIGAKAKMGTVLISDSTKKTDWYKVTLKKNMAFTIDMTSYVSGKLNMEICDSKGRTALSGTKTLTSAQHNKISTSAKWSKGTYYIKISKVNAKSCGYYELKIKK